jgi:hypothetical protein
MAVMGVRGVAVTDEGERRGKEMVEKGVEAGREGGGELGKGEGVGGRGMGNGSWCVL